MNILHWTWSLFQLCQLNWIPCITLSNNNYKFWHTNKPHETSSQPHKFIYQTKKVNKQLDQMTHMVHANHAHSIETHGYHMKKWNILEPISYKQFKWSDWKEPIKYSKINRFTRLMTRYPLYIAELWSRILLPVASSDYDSKWNWRVGRINYGSGVYYNLYDSVYTKP